MIRPIHIFYLHYNIAFTDHKARPGFFDYESCFLNLLNSVKNQPEVNIYVVMDGKIEDNWIKKYKNYYTPHEANAGDMYRATINLFNAIKNTECDNEDLIYILENDYLHKSDWVSKIRNLYESHKDLDYITLYDHGDKYTYSMYDNLKSKIIVSKDHHWRSTPSTCGSYITTKKIIMQDYDDHTGVTTPITDHNKWLFLAATKNRKVFSALPGLSTHCMIQFLSPAVDWEHVQKLSLNTIL